MDMVVILIAMLFGLATAVPVQYAIHFFNIRGHGESLLVFSAFAGGMALSAPYIANVLGV